MPGTLRRASFLVHAKVFCMNPQHFIVAVDGIGCVKLDQPTTGFSASTLSIDGVPYDYARTVQARHAVKHVFLERSSLASRVRRVVV